MYFFCKEVKVENHEYHYHCTRNPNTKTSKQPKKKLLPRIETMATNTPSTIQSRTSQLNININKQSTTLLQRLRRKTESLAESSQSATHMKKMEKTSEKIIVLDQSVPERMRNTDSCGGSSGASSVMVRENMDFRSFSFGINKQVMESETFNEEVQESQHYVIQQESELVEHSISGKFTQIFCHISTQLYDETLSIDTTLPFAVTIKTFTCPQPDKHLHKQLQLYNKIGHHQNILDIYQVCFDNGKPIIIKQPYQKIKPSSSIDKELIRKDIGCLLMYLEEVGVRVGRVMIGHLRGCFGVWKLGDFGALVGGDRVTVEDNIQQLLNQIN